MLANRNFGGEVNMAARPISEPVKVTMSKTYACGIQD